MRLFFYISLIGLFAVVSTDLLAYYSGLRGTPPFFVLEAIGFCLVFFGSVILIGSSKNIGKTQRFSTVCFTLVLTILFCWKGSDLFLRTYAVGFEKTIFRVATRSDWNSLTSIAEKYLLTQTNNEFEESLPLFVLKVYPERYVLTGISSPDNNSNTIADADIKAANLSVLIFWPNPPIDVGLNIGVTTHPRGELYRKKVDEKMSVVIFRDPQ